MTDVPGQSCIWHRTARMSYDVAVSYLGDKSQASALRNLQQPRAEHYR